MAEFVLFCLPTIVYMVVLSRGSNRTSGEVLARAGAVWGPPVGYGWAGLLLVPLVLLGWAATAVMPVDVLDKPGIVSAQVTSVGAALGIVLRAFGEEIFFRGLLGGVLMRRLGFTWGNLVQAVIFLLPHLALLLVDTRLWPILPVQFTIGWLLGWLRHRTDTFVPGGALHAIVNLVAAAITV